MSDTAQIAIEALMAAARGGDPEAQFTIARRFDAEGRHDVAVGWLGRAAGAGHVRAMTFLGARLLAGRAAPAAPEDGLALIRRAAEAGDAEGARLFALLLAAGAGCTPDWPSALAWLDRAADRGDASAVAQRKVLASLRDGFTDRPLEPLCEGSRIGVVRGLIAPDICRWLIGRAEGRLQQTGVYGAAAVRGELKEIRSNTGAGFTLFDNDLPMLAARAALAKAAAIAPERQEPVNILHYSVGQTFAPHYDFLNPSAPGFAATIALEGQRAATGLIYLNDDYEGGETEFPELGVRFRGAVGDALVFHSILPSGAPDYQTVHAGLPPTAGEKWVLSQWFRTKPQPLV